MTRVLHLLNYAGQGGTEQYIRTLLQALEGQGVQAELACNETGPLAQWAEARGLPVHSLAMASPFDRGAVKALAALCRDRKIDVIHTHYLRENYIALQAKGKVPGLRVVYTYHILTQNSLAQRVCNRLLSRRQDAVVANCTAGARQLVANGIPQGQIHLIYNAVDPTQWQDPATTLRQEIGAEAGDFVLLFAARLVEGKGHAFLLESLAQLRENTAHPFRLVLAGEGPLRQDLESQTQALGLADRVTFLGFRSDMSNLYHGADLTLCPSESETLSLLLLESLACGTPVLATRVGGIPDIVTPAHDVGCLVDYGDRAGLAAALEAVMADPAQLARWGANGPRVVAETFSVATQSARMLALYEGRTDPQWN